MRLLLSFILVLCLSTSSFAITDVSTCQTFNTYSTSYRLTADVSSTGTCFTIAAQKVKLNLNGHTVTYDNATPITVTNGGFETGDSTGWDFANAPNASVAAGSFINPVTLYSGSYALRFALPASDQYVLSANTVTLAANTTYSLSAMFRNSGNNETTQNDYVGGFRDPIVMTVSIDGTAYSATTPQPGVTWRGFQFSNVVFTTGANPVTGKIRISISGVPSGAIGYIYVDDVKILRANSYGVDVAPNNANSKNFIITNGSITQGQGNGFNSHAVNMGEQGREGFSIDHLILTVQGVNSRAIAGYHFNGSTINYNTINHNVTTIQSRDNYDGAAIYIAYNSISYNSTIHHNIFATGVQTAIFLQQTLGQTPNQVYNNNITLQSRYTNDFAIVANGAEVYGNTVNCGTSSNACRGIVVSGANTKVHNNTITVQELVRNQEYNGCQTAGAYGMQAEYSAVNAEVYGNTVTANAGDCEGSALRINPDAPGTGVSMNIHDNTFTAVASGSARATTMRFADMNSPTTVLINNNTFRTNRRWAYIDYSESGTDNVVFTGNRFETTGTVDNPFYGFEINSSSIAATFNFFSNTYGTGDQARFESQCWRATGNMLACASGPSIVIDGAAPYPPTTSANKSGRYQSSQQVTLTCTDGSATCATTLYCLGPECTPALTYSAPFYMLQNIAHQTTCFASTDTSSNREATKCVSLAKQRRR